MGVEEYGALLQCVERWLASNAAAGKQWASPAEEHREHAV